MEVAIPLWKVPYCTTIRYFSDYENLYFLLLSIIQLSTTYFLPREWSPSGPYSTSIPLALILSIEIMSDLASSIRKYFQAVMEGRQVVTCMIDGVIVKKMKKEIFPGDIVVLNKEQISPVSGTLFCSSDVHFAKIDTSLTTGETSLKYFDLGSMISSGDRIMSERVEIIVTKNDTIKKVSEITSQRNNLDIFVSEYMVKTSIPLLIFFILISSVFKTLDLKVFRFSYLISSWVMFNGIIPFSVKIFLILSRKITGLFLFPLKVNNYSLIDDISRIKHIISDKTGTITKNKLKVIDAKFSKLPFFSYSCIENDTEEDKAILEYENLPHEIIRVFPFDHQRKTSGKIVQVGGKIKLCVKGSIDSIKNISLTSQVEPISSSGPQFEFTGSSDFRFGSARSSGFEFESISSSGLRLLAFGSRNLSQDEIHQPREELEKDLNFDGIISMSDEMQEGVKETVCKLRNDYGAKTSLCTGDKKEAALQYAIQAGIVADKVLEYSTFSEKRSNSEVTLLFGSENLCDENFLPCLSRCNNFVAYNMKPADKEYVATHMKDVLCVGDGFNDLGMFSSATVSVAVKREPHVEKLADYCISSFQQLQVLFSLSSAFRKRNINIINFTFYRSSLVVAVLAWYYLHFNYSSPFNSFVTIAFNNIWSLGALVNLLLNDRDQISTSSNLWNLRGIAYGLFLVELLKENMNPDMLTLFTIFIINIKWVDWKDKRWLVLNFLGPVMYILYMIVTGSAFGELKLGVLGLLGVMVVFL